MLNLVRSFFKDGIFNLGLFMIALSGAFFFAANPSGEMFFVNYVISVFYFIIVWISGRLKKGRDGIYPVFAWLITALISAYVLNREMRIFADSVNWLCVLLVLSCANFLLLRVWEQLPIWARCMSAGVMGLSALLFIYQSIYLIPVMPVSVIAFWALGIPLHGMVPVVICIYITVAVCRFIYPVKLYRHVFFGTVLAGFTFVTLFVCIWMLQVQKLNRLNDDCRDSLAHLPRWVQMAEVMPRNHVATLVLKTGLIYNGGDPNDVKMGAFGDVSRWSALEVELKHDPLIKIASFIGGRTEVSDEDRIAILKAMYNARHTAESRLWSGRSLFTKQVNTTAEIWPDLRLSYTEMVVDVERDGEPNEWSRRSGEAIYTFQLPEGGVVTSLSLWINGNEEKGLLTTKEKADSAYRTIVGVESRDPSVVHWMEGNTVTVRVFPVPQGDSRKFKIGVTAPLQAYKDQLRYKSISFQGPAASDAKAKTELRFATAPRHMQLTGRFNRVDEKTFTHEGDYHDQWGAAFDRTPIGAGNFTFNGAAYSMVDYTPLREIARLDKVYLDVNGSWSYAECSEIFGLLDGKKIYVPADDGAVTELTADNREERFEALRRRNFSLFPFSAITDPAHAMVITKGTPYSPSLNDLKAYGWLTRNVAFFQQQEQLRLYNIGAQLSPYIHSLKQCQVFAFEQGDVKQLAHLLQTGLFISPRETADQLPLDMAGVAIKRSEQSANTGIAPDHLLRLFAYNDILHRSGPALLNGPVTDSSLMEEARQAYVVSPVSSLVVLESQADYDRFGIDASKNSLQNAALSGKGAVPEPYEWALIILAVAALLWYRFRPQYKL